MREATVARLGWAGAATLAAALIAAFSMPAFAADASAADKLVVEEPTFVCLGVEWFVKGDDNGNATVDCHYRKAGEAEWREAMPLWRVDSTDPIKKVPAGQALFAGSIFGLDEGTKYEMKLNLKDADGGDSERIVTATTRVTPVIPKDGRDRYVVPGEGGGTGTKDDPFKGLKSANAAAAPGDIMHVAAGTYPGLIEFTKSGAAERPIVWLGPADNSAIIDGGGAERAVTADNLQHVWFWHLTIQNAHYAFVAHESSYTVVRYCRISAIDAGYTATRNPMKGNAVLDSVFDGWVPWEIDGKRVCYPDTTFQYKGHEYDVTDINAVCVSGEGTVVAYNRMKAWGDGIHGSGGDQPKCANDYYCNEVSESGDDGIECDTGAQNIRCFDNRFTNCFQGISTQPVYGGPTYIFRNVQYNTNYEPYKLHDTPHGILLINNTSVRAATNGGPLWVHTGTTVYHSLVANNLFAGGDDSRAIDMSPPMRDAHWDYDGYVGGPWETFAKWNGEAYKTLEDFRKGTGQEEHGIILPAQGLFASGVMPTKSPDTQVEVSVNDLRLAAGTKAIDAGKVFPGITDGFTGAAPDLGACELGQPLPHYGPRPEK